MSDNFTYNKLYGKEAVYPCGVISPTPEYSLGGGNQKPYDCDSSLYNSELLLMSSESYKYLFEDGSFPDLF